MNFLNFVSSQLSKTCVKIPYRLIEREIFQTRFLRRDIIRRRHLHRGPLAAETAASRLFTFLRNSPTMVRTLIVSLLILTSSLASSLPAQDWAEKMFNKRDHDFGTVARGADTVYRFEITNLYKQTMQITGVRSSCGCTTPSIENKTIKTHEKAYLVAKFNTRTYTGLHGATLTVSFGAPYHAEVQVRVHGNIRGDVVFSPGAVQYGNVDEGVSAEQSLTVNYAGHDRWEIVDVTNDNDHFEVELKEMSRGFGKVSYNLLVRLKGNVPTGFVNDQLTVVTNDPRAENQRIPLFVTGRIVPEISVTPTTLVLGDITAGTEVTKKVVVRGKNPFRIVDVSCEDDCFTFDIPEDAKTLHLVGITFRPRNHPGDVRVPVRILTDRGNNRGTIIEVSAKVSDPPPPAESQADDGSPSSEETSTARVTGGASS
jgi:hypothetical protein